jgi:hypothetical protein
MAGPLGGDSTALFMPGERIMEKEKAVVTANISESSMGQALSKLALGLKAEQARVPGFVTSVLSVSDDHSSVKVKLCTGGIIDIPVSILKQVSHLGTVTSGDQCFGIASGEIDVSSGVGKLVWQMAHEINRLSSALETTQEALRRVQSSEINKSSALSEETPRVRMKRNITPSDTVLPLTVIKIPFNGIAGDPFHPAFVFYQAPPHQYINEWEVIAHPNCFFKSPPIVGGIDTDGKTIGLQFFPDAIQGTPIGNSYSATIIVSVVLVQRTT